MDAILSSKDEGARIRRLPTDEAQVFIDAVDKVRSTIFVHKHRFVNFLIRYWIHRTFRSGPKGNASGCCTGHVATMHSSQESLRSQPAMADPATTRAGVDMPMCGRANVVARMLP